MMPQDAEDVLAYLARHSPSRPSEIHGDAHWRRVAVFGLELARDLPTADPMVVLLFSMLHDSLRYHDGVDSGHGKRAALLVDRLSPRYVVLPDRSRRLLIAACMAHNRGLVTSDATVGTCWDADRLDLPRLGIEPATRFLSTEPGKRLALKWRQIPSGHQTWKSIIDTYEVLWRVRSGDGNVPAWGRQGNSADRRLHQLGQDWKRRERDA
jgi:uncharacterized protein